MRLLVRAVCGLFLVAAVGVIGGMAIAIGRNNIETFRNWNSLYDYMIAGGVVFFCALLGMLADTSSKGLRRSLAVLGIFMLAGGIMGHYGFQFLSGATLAPIPPMKQLKPNAAEIVLGYHYVCPESGGNVAFGDGAVRYVDREQFATLLHADTPDQTPEFISPIKKPLTSDPKENTDEQPGNDVLSSAQERIMHANNLKKMAVDHIQFQPRDGIRVPLKPEHFKTYSIMTDELREAISDGTYVWYFGWEPVVSYHSEKTRALWYDFASWASIYCAGFGAGLLLAGLVLMIRRPQQTLVAGTESV